MNKLAWLGIGYAIYLGVENWTALRALETDIKQIRSTLEVVLKVPL